MSDPGRARGRFTAAGPADATALTGPIAAPVAQVERLPGLPVRRGGVM
ncbi:hypothetical protein [Streptomyces sp. YGL11-2]